MPPIVSTSSGPAAWQATIAQLDQYAALSHKMPLDPRRPNSQGLAPTWVPATDQRRLSAYKVLGGYVSNVARVFLSGATAEQIDSHREYGDADLLVKRIVAGVLGDTVAVVVDGVGTPPPDAPVLPPEPEDPGTNGSPLDKRIHAARHARWSEAAVAAVDDWDATWATYPDLVAYQTLLDAWADDEQLTAKLTEANTYAVSLGDGVLTVEWSARSQRPVVTVYDPGFYFPVVTDDDDGFVATVHMAWELETDDGTRMVRRKTWRLDTCTPTVYPYQPGVVSTVACYFTDATWRLDQLDGNGLSDLSERGATYAVTDDGHEAHDLNLGFDFLPVVHIPNTPNTTGTFGQSSLTSVAQILDDLSGVDTDTASSARFIGAPVIALSGSEAKGPTHVQPGVIHNTGPDGKMTVLDLSTGTAALMELDDRMLDRLSVNARVPAETLGRVSAQESALSGIAVALRLGPFAQHISQLRLTRDPKDQLLIKMVGRLFQVHKVLEAGVLPAARVALGSFLPSDRAELVANVTSLLEAHAISTETAVSMLVAGGFTIHDASGEVARIRADNPEAAKDLADATGSEQLAAEWLDVKLPESPPLAVTIPVVP